MTALAWIGLGAIIVAALIVIADEAVDDMLARAQFDLAEADAEWDALMDEIGDGPTPTFRRMCAENPDAVDALARVEAERADWSQVEGRSL